MSRRASWTIERPPTHTARSRPIWLVGSLIIVIVMVKTLASASPALAASPLSWAPPLRADASPPFASPAAINGIACPSANLCIAVDGVGEVLTATEPDGGASAWSKTALEGGFNAISCPTRDFCAAGGFSGNIIVSTDPTGGAAAWSKTTVGIKSIQSISCPSTSFCVAASYEGNVAISTNPTGGSAAWSVVHIDGERSHIINGISCPSLSLCVAVSSEGELITSTDPTGGSGAWTISRVASGGTTISDISCPSEDLCVANEDGAQILTSTEPTGGAGAWSATKINGAISLGRTSCPTASFCAVIGDSGVFTSIEPTAGAEAWTSTPIHLPNKYGGEYSIEDVFCAGESLCVLTDSGSGVITSVEPTGGEAAWSVTELPIGRSSIESVSCVSIQLCVAVDNAGNMVSTTDPVGTKKPWHSVHTSEGKLTGVSCASRSLCVAVDEAGDVFTSTEPTGEAAAWTRADVDGTIPLLGISCASPSLCVAIDRHGDVLSSTEPTSGASAWSAAYVTSENSLESISCASASLCVALAGGEPLVSTDPDGGAGTWVRTAVQAEHSISCPSTELCVSVLFPGPETIVTSIEPAGGASAWSATTVEGLHGLEEVGCAASGLCLATTYGGSGSSDGNVWVSTDPAGWAGSWIEDNVYGNAIVGPNPMLNNYSVTLSGVSCVSDGMCVVVDLGGNAMVGASAALMTTPVSIEKPTISGTAALGQTLSCSQGSWENTPTSYAYAWLRDGAPIAAEGAATYTVQSADAGHAISCEVTASNGGGSASATSNPVQVPAIVPPPISNNFKILRARVRRGGSIAIVLAAPGPGRFTAIASMRRTPAILRALRDMRGREKRGLGRPCEARRTGGKDHWRGAICYGKGSAYVQGAGIASLIIKPQSGLFRRLKGLPRFCVRAAVTYVPRGADHKAAKRTVVCTER